MNKSKTIAVGAICALAATGTTATAASLITSAKIADGTIMNRDIHRGTISESRLDRGVVAKLNRLAIPGPSGARGATGAKGDAGATGATGARGAAGQDGATGAAASQNTLNPAVAVKASGNAGWSYIGAPAATLTGGELRLAGGFDNSTIAGGIGIAKTYDAPLASLSALSYDVLVHARPNDLSAPAIHVSLMGANTGTQTGFVNLVFEPYQNGGTTVGARKSFDALSGKWWATRDLAAGTDNAIARQALASLEQIKATSPDARIVAISVDNGNTSGTGTIPVDQLSMGADNLVVGFGAGFDRYDFGG
jgi:hypothetical protein